MSDLEWIFLGQAILFPLALVLLNLPVLFIFSEEFVREKLSSYECGFEPFEESRSPFEVQFYLVSVLFMLFDLEVSFLFPFIVFYLDWVLCLQFISIFLFFFFILILGFIYEWQSGILDWHI